MQQLLYGGKNNNNGYSQLVPMLEDKFVNKNPSNQNGIDCFPELWSSKFPDEFEVNAGECEVFIDQRLEWGLSHFCPKNSWDVLELGPLEGGHGYYLEKNTPVRSITAVEGNRQCWLRCLITKEITDLKRTRFLLGNFIDYLKENEGMYDLCLAFGVLYHMKNPFELIQLLSKASDRVIIWTQLVTSKQQEDWQAIKLKDGEETVIGYINDYGMGVKLDNFIGGLGHYSVWITKDTLVDSLCNNGFSSVQVGMEGENKFGNFVTITASKK